jgi:hypothetical protein
MGKAYVKAEEDDVRAIIIYMIFFVDLFFSCVSYCFASIVTVDMLVWGIVIFYSPIKRIFLN